MIVVFLFALMRPRVYKFIEPVARDFFLSAQLIRVFVSVIRVYDRLALGSLTCLTFVVFVTV